MSKYNRRWTQAEALVFLADLETKAASVGLHVALAGSVLYRGYSEKDLDVIIYPHEKTDGSPWRGNAYSFVCHHVGHAEPCDSPYRDGKEVYYSFVKEGPFAGRRVDFFLLS